MKVAALDLGSNTFLCLIAEVSEGGLETVYSDSVEVVRLGQELDKTGRFHPEALIRADDCLKKFSKIIEQYQPQKILAMATSAARDASNKMDLFSIAEKYGIPLEIIPGDMEASITYQGAVCGRREKNRNLLVVDIGGGSTEFIFGCGEVLLNGQSFDMGCVRLTERFVTDQPTSEAEIDLLRNEIDLSLNAAKGLTTGRQVDEILAVAGTPTSLAAAELGGFKSEALDGFILTKEKLTHWLMKLKNSTIDQKIKMGIPKGRADVILVGVLILIRTLEVFEKEQLTVSTKGVRYGIALEMARRARLA